jgi:hypothetical protein
MPCRETWLCSGVFESGSAATGGTFYVVEVSGESPTGNNCGPSSIDGFLAHVLFILIPISASTLVSKGGAVCGNSASTDLCGVVSRMREKRNAVPEMKVDPSEPAYRSRLQTT